MRSSQSTHLLMFLSLEALTSIIRTGLPILVKLIDLVNSVLIFLSQMTLLRWLTFLLGSQTDSHSSTLLDFFLSSDASTCSTIAFPPLGNSDHVVVSCCWFHRNHFFRLYQKDKSSNSKVKFRQASNHWEKVLEAARLTLIKQKSLLLPRNLALATFSELLILFSTKVNLLYLLYSQTWRCCLLHLIKQNFLLKTFLRTLILMTQVSLYQFSLLELIWNCIIFL